MHRVTDLFILLIVALTGCGIPSARPSYVGGKTCLGCHEREANLWLGSDHYRSMEPATDTTVLGDFDRAVFTLSGDSTEFFTSGGEFMVATERTPGRRDTLKIAYTFGFEPLQQYLVPTDRGRYQALTLAWDTEKMEWFSLYPDSDVEPGEFIHWTGRGMTWNYMCAECHSTALRKSYDLTTDTYSTTFSEIDVSCEACHGPGEMHVRMAGAEKDGSPWPDSSYGLTVIMRPERSPSTEISVCAPCHSRRTTLDDDFIPGDRFLDHYAPALLDEGLYFADGQIDDEVYVYGSFTQSKMFRWGVRCSDCHDIHSGKLRLEGNLLCAQCHDRTIYDVAEHLQHRPETPASQCVTCHMPERTYMQVDPRRDHSMILPRPASASRYGVPDVCGTCHPDRSSDQLDRDLNLWRTDSTTVNQGSAIMASAFSGGRLGDTDALVPLKQIIRDTTFAPIIRATATSLLGPYRAEDVLEVVSEELRDEDPLVRIGALRAADALGPAVPPAVIAPLVQDSMRWVRANAARLLVLRGVQPTQSISGLDAAIEEYRAMQYMTEDQPESHLNLAAIAEGLGDDMAAESSYRTALKLDSTFTPAYLRLGLLFNQRRREALQTGNLASATEFGIQAQIEFREAIRTGKDSLASAHYMLGLLLAEAGASLREAADHLEMAARYEPSNARMFYNAGLARQRLGDTGRAEKLLRQAAGIESDNTDYQNALVILFIQQERWKEALDANETLLSTIPGNKQLADRRRYLKDRIAGSDK